MQARAAATGNRSTACRTSSNWVEVSGVSVSPLLREAPFDRPPSIDCDGPSAAGGGCIAAVAGVTSTAAIATTLSQFIAILTPQTDARGMLSSAEQGYCHL